jgi:hypothetical protein
VRAGDARMLSATAGARARFVLGDVSYRYSLRVEDTPKSVDPLLVRLVLSRYGVQSLLLMRWVQMG